MCGASGCNCKVPRKSSFVQIGFVVASKDGNSHFILHHALCFVLSLQSAQALCFFNVHIYIYLFIVESVQWVLCLL